MKILGIDPGSRKLGWAIIEINGKKLTYIKSGVLTFDKIDNFLDRLCIITKSIKEIVSNFEPDEISLESLIFVKNISSLAKLAQARGSVVSGLSEKYQGKIFEYSPNNVKSVVSGHGHATKEGVEKMLNMIFGVIKFKTNDESDALAIAVCHALSRNSKVSSLPARASTKSRSLKDVFKKVK